MKKLEIILSSLVLTLLCQLFCCTSSNNGNSVSGANQQNNQKKLLTDFGVKCLAISGSTIYAGTEDGVFLLANKDSSWTQVNNGLTSNMVLSLAISGSNIFAGTMHGLFLSKNNGSSWTMVEKYLNKTCKKLVISGSNIFAIGYMEELFKSSDNGNTWKTINVAPGLAYELNALAVNGSNIFVGTDRIGVLLSTDNGDNWTPVNKGLLTQYCSPNPCSITDINITDKVIYMSTRNGIFISLNNGNNWNVVKEWSGESNGHIAVSASNIYTSAFEGIPNAVRLFQSKDNGKSWSESDNHLHNLQKLYSINGTNIFVRTKDGIFTSTNGNSWTAISNTITNEVK